MLVPLMIILRLAWRIDELGVWVLLCCEALVSLYCLEAMIDSLVLDL